MRVSILSLLAGLALIAPAAAFDDLLNSVGVLSLDMDKPKAFSYIAPPDGFAADDAEFFGSFGTDPMLPRALATGGVDELTGIDFGKVTAAITVDLPPKTTTMLFAEPGFAEDAAETLLARGFEQSEFAGLPVFAMGEDNLQDRAGFGQPDPFGKGIGMAQRLAIADDHLVRTTATPDMQAALDGLETPSTMHGIWTNTISGLRQVAGDGATLEHATGLTMTAFVPRPRMLAPSSGKTKSNGARFEPEQIFPVAVLALTRTATETGIHIAVPFNDATLAAEASEVIAARLAALPEAPADAQLTVLPVGEAGPMAVAVLSISAPLDSDRALRSHYTGWLHALDGNFPPLTFEPMGP